MKIETLAKGDTLAHLLLRDVDLTAEQTLVIELPFARRAVLTRALAISGIVTSLSNGASLLLKEINPFGTVTASLSTNLTGANNDLVYSARVGGAAGNGITVEYVSQGIIPSAALSVVTSLLNRTIKVYLENDAGTKSSLSTALTGANNDLDFTAQLAGIAGDDISVEYINPATPSAALGVVVADKKITVNLATDAGVNQVETAVAVGTIDEATQQVETATVVGVIEPAGAGDASVTVTADGMPNSPKTIAVAVANDDTAALVAGKIRAALIADADIGDATTGFFTITGSGADIILTKKTAAADDATMNVAIDNGTCAGLTAAPTSADTTAGKVGPGNATVTVTAAAVAGSPVAVNVAVAAGDTAAEWAEKVRTALAANSAIAAQYDVGGADENITLTKIVAAANDDTLNIALANGTCSGITEDTTSDDTTAGVVPAITSTAAQVAAAVAASAAAAALVAVANTAGNDGTGVVTAMAEDNLASGVDPVIVTTAAEIETALEANADAMRLISVANKAANDGSGVVIAMAAAPLANGAVNQTVDVQTLVDQDLADTDELGTVQTLDLETGVKVLSADTKLSLVVTPGTADADSKDIVLELLLL